MKNRFIEIAHVRTTDQKDAMIRIQLRGTCPFCLKNLKKEHKKPILHVGKYWILTEAQFPYEEARMHFLIISKKHAQKISDLNNRSGNELFFLLQLLEKKYKIKSGGIAMRFGDIKNNGGTVNHLHIHVLIPHRISSKRFQVLRFRISGKKDPDYIV